MAPIQMGDEGKRAISEMTIYKPDEDAGQSSTSIANTTAHMKAQLLGLSTSEHASSSYMGTMRKIPQKPFQEKSPQKYGGLRKNAKGKLMSGTAVDMSRKGSVMRKRNTNMADHAVLGTSINGWQNELSYDVDSTGLNQSPQAQHFTVAMNSLSAVKETADNLFSSSMASSLRQSAVRRAKRFKDTRDSLESKKNTLVAVNDNGDSPRPDVRALASARRGSKLPIDEASKKEAKEKEQQPKKKLRDFSKRLQSSKGFSRDNYVPVLQAKNKPINQEEAVRPPMVVSDKNRLKQHHTIIKINRAKNTSSLSHISHGMDRSSDSRESPSLPVGANKYNSSLDALTNDALLRNISPTSKRGDISARGLDSERAAAQKLFEELDMTDE